MSVWKDEGGGNEVTEVIEFDESKVVEGLEQGAAAPEGEGVAAVDEADDKGVSVSKSGKKKKKGNK